MGGRMRRLLIICMAIILICIIIPVIFTRQFQEKEIATLPEQLENNSVVQNQENYSQYENIKLLHTKTNQIEEVPIETYLYNVVSAEMPADFEYEALKAQAIVARTYTIYKIKNNSDKHGEANICDDSTCCQAWISKEDRFARWEEAKREENWKKIVSAVDETKGKIVTYEGEPINAFFHSNSGGKTEIPLNVWGGSGYPYLQTVETVGEDAYSQYNSEAELTKTELESKVKEKHSDFSINWEEENCIQVLERTDGNRVKNIKIGNKNLSGVEIRSLLGLRSTNFTVTVENDKIKFSVIGYGHGVGMSQTGADAMAKQGKNYEEIIKHFYTNVEIENVQ